MKSSKYSSYINIIRVFACFCVLFYHLNILKGGFLAVNIFFVLFGYFMMKNALYQQNFSIKKFYTNKFFRIYLPVIITIFVSIDLINLIIPDLLWFNLKPETNSILLMFNNYWQINANMDYFANVTDSPFMHLWYIAISLQFCLIFPFFYKFINYIKNKTNENIPMIILSSLSAIGVLIFIYYFYYNNLMSTYYGFETRIFAILLGVTLAYAQKYYNQIIIKFKNPIYNKIVFFSYLLILFGMMIFISSESKYMMVSMILSSFITLRMISYSILIKNEKSSKVLKFLGDISYEVYLVQYPVIYMFSTCNLSLYLKIPLMIISIFVLAWIIYYGLLVCKKSNLKISSIFIDIFLCAAVVGGLIVYINTEDHTKEMNALKEELASNEESFTKMEKTYQENFQKEQENYNNLLNSYEKTDDELSELITSLPIVAIGDSVMLGAVPNLTEMFPNGYFNAEVSRTCYVAKNIINDLNTQNMLGDVVIIHMGTNGDCGNKTRENIMNLLKDKEVFWITVTNDRSVGVNDKLKAFKENYSNMHIIDWESISNGHSEYFYADGIHLTGPGREAYTNMIYNEIFNLYKKKQEENKNQLILEHENNQKNKITFYGNDLLLNTYNSLLDSYPNSIFNINKDYNFENIKNELIDLKNQNLLTNKIVIMLDNQVSISKDEYEDLVNMLEQASIYIVTINKNLDLENTNNFINFYSEILNNNDYMLADDIHLSKIGNEKLIEKIKEILN